MPSANDSYQNIMSSLQKMNLKPALKSFLEQQSLSLMRGIQICDNDKIKSMLILLNAASSIDAHTSNCNSNLFNQLILEISKNVDNLDHEYKQNIEDSKSYIENLLYHKADKNELKEKFNGKPWLLHDQKSTSHRISIGLKKPESNLPGSGLIPTKNDKGWEIPPIESDIFSKQFEKDVISDQIKKRVLILGAGYGTSAYSLLENSKHNKTKFVINDLSSEHMDIFKDQLPTEFDGRVTVISGNILNEVQFPDNHFDQILLRNVIHFFTPEQIDNCLNLIYGWLKPGGALKVTASTPYWGINSKNSISSYEQKKANGDEWPGFIPNLKEFLEKQGSLVTALTPSGPLHNFDESILKSVLLKHKFQLAQSGLFAMPKTFPKRFQKDGREYVGADAYKPKI